MFFPSKPFQPSLMFVDQASGLYYKHITVVNYDSSVINKCVASLSDDARVVIYDRRVFAVQATGVCPKVEHLKGASIR